MGVFSVFAFLLGSCIGSFLNVVIDRVPEGKSLVGSRSACPNCHRTLSEFEMVPILSFLALKGKCRTCASRIPLPILFVEVATAFLFLGLASQHGYDATFWALAAATAVMVVIVIIDWEHSLILNFVTYPSILIALALAPFWPQMSLEREFFGNTGALGSFLNSMVSGGGALVVFTIIYTASRGGIGEGDLKLVFLMGLLLGFPGIVASIWLGVVAGGVIAVGLLVTKRKKRGEAIPFGPYLAGGALAVIMMMPWLMNRYQENGLGSLLGG